MALLLGAAPRAMAQDAADAMKPVVVVSFAGYAELKRDLAYLGAAAGNPDMAQGLEALLLMMTQNQGLAGLDEERPWGAAVGFGPAGPAGWACLPVTDLQKLFGALGALNLDPQEVDDGVWKLDVHGISAFIKQQGDWTFASDLPTSLANVPDDPARLLGDLPKKYDLAVRLHIQNVPPFLRDAFVDMFKGRLEEQSRLGDNNETLAQAVQALVGSMHKAINELDQITLGFSIDREAKRSTLELVETALEGSDTARQMAAPAAGGSHFAGFLLPGSLVSLHLNSAFDEREGESMSALLSQFREQAMEEFDDDEDLDDEERDVAKEVVGELLDVVGATVQRGHVNLGLTVTGDMPLNVALGGFVADGSRLETIIRKRRDLLAAGPGAPTIKLDVAKHDGVAFHTVTIPAPEEQVKQVLGDPLTLTLGFGAESFYAALGPEGIDTIRQVMSRSASAAADASQLHVRLSLGQALAIAAKFGGGNPSLDDAAVTLQGDDADHVHVMVSEGANGVQFRIEVEEGILKLLGNAMKMAVPGGGNLR
jgi:hypothetical protein